MLRIKVAVTYNIDQNTIDDLLEGAHIQYWGLFVDQKREKVQLLDARKGERRTFKLNIMAGLKRMAKLSPAAFADIVNDNWDAGTADELVQYAALGKLVYG